MSVNQNNTNNGRDAKFCVSTFIFIWFIINILQSIFTEIHADEAYYALFGEHLAWGYFDHPPMVGLMTFLSSLLFSDTLGVRFFTVITSCLSLWVMWKIVNPDCFVIPPRNDTKRQLNNSELSTSNSQLSTLNPKLFFSIACSIVMFNIYGFVTTPDAGLILFSALFLLVYQRYLEDKSWKNALLMGLLITLMVYSKYHAFLLFGLIVLSNLRLLKDGKFWVACLVVLVLLIPHILWQINADFPTLKYHLSQRSEPFRWSYFLEYLPNQLLVFNPFTFGAVVYVLIKHKSWITSSRPLIMLRKFTASDSEKYHIVIANETKQSGQDVFERGLSFILIGFFFFFWLMTFRGHVEPHWTAVCTIPVVVLVYRKAIVDNKLQKYIRWFVLPSLLLVVFMRVALLTSLSTSFGFYGKEQHYQAIASVADDRPVIFQGSFQQPALYRYFTGKESSTLRWYYDRATQYDLWQFDKAWLGKSVFVYNANGTSAEQYRVGNESFTGYLANDFQTANRLEIEFSIVNLEDFKTPVVHTNDTLQIDFSIHNPCEQIVEFQPEMALKLLLVNDNEVRYGFYERIIDLKPNETYQGRFSVVLGSDTKLGKNRLLLCIGDRYALFGALQDAVEVVIEAL